MPIAGIRFSGDIYVAFKLVESEGTTALLYYVEMDGETYTGDVTLIEGE